MPHFVVDASLDVMAVFRAAGGMRAVHDCAVGTGHFDAKSVKVRCFATDDYLISGERQGFLHVTAHILSGRDQGTKALIAAAVLECLNGLNLPAASISVDVQDMDRAVYCKKLA